MRLRSAMRTGSQSIIIRRFAEQTPDGFISRSGGYIESVRGMSLKELAEQRIAEFTGTLKKYIL